MPKEHIDKLHSVPFYHPDLNRESARTFLTNVAKTCGHLYLGDKTSSGWKMPVRGFAILRPSSEMSEKAASEIKDWKSHPFSMTTVELKALSSAGITVDAKDENVEEENSNLVFYDYNFNLNAYHPYEKIVKGSSFPAKKDPITPNEFREFMQMPRLFEHFGYILVFDAKRMDEIQQLLNQQNKVQINSDYGLCSINIPLIENKISITESKSREAEIKETPEEIHWRKVYEGVKATLIRDRSNYGDPLGDKLPFRPPEERNFPPPKTAESCFDSQLDDKQMTKRAIIEDYRWREFYDNIEKIAKAFMKTIFFEKAQAWAKNGKKEEEIIDTLKKELLTEIWDLEQELMCRRADYVGKDLNEHRLPDLGDSLKLAKSAEKAAAGEQKTQVVAKHIPHAERRFRYQTGVGTSAKVSTDGIYIPPEAGNQGKVEAQPKASDSAASASRQESESSRVTNSDRGLFSSAPAQAQPSDRKKHPPRWQRPPVGSRR